MKTKICCTCKKRKRVSGFYADKHRSDGLYPRCKTCHYACTYRNSQNAEVKAKRRIKDRERYYADHEYQLSRLKKYRETEHGKAVFKRNNAETYLNHRDKALARASIRYHTKKGNMPYARDLPCAWCSKQASDYHHHHGYSKDHKRDVIPLCKTCHGITRRKD